MSDSHWILEGRLHVDNRGSLAFFNEFAFPGVARFYIIRPERPQEVRGWIGHQREQKWFTAVEGTIAVAVVRPDDWQSPDAHAAVLNFVLSATKPQILTVPPGHATAIIGISPQSALMVFSTGSIEQAPSDSYRFPSDFWKIRMPLNDSQ
jgi:dTDP-4-dehydrorhamnose 3,5-epimerase-like enzyme